MVNTGIVANIHKKVIEEEKKVDKKSKKKRGK